MADVSEPTSPINRRLVVAYRISLVVSLAYVVAFALFQQQTKDFFHIDFKQYYLGAWIARTGQWDALYPEPTPGGLHNAGVDGTPKPAMLDLAHRVTPGEPTTYFIQPPPTAVLLAPLAWFDYSTANKVWVVLGAVAAWGTAVFGGRIIRVISGASGPTVLEVVCLLLIAFHPRTARYLMLGNVSPFVGVALAGAVYWLAAGRLILSTVAIGVAAVLKVSPLVLLPLLWVRFPPRTAALACGGFVLVILGTAFITGVGPWVEFLTQISPTLARPWLPATSDAETDLMTGSVHGLVWLFVRQNPLPPLVSTAITVAGVGVLVGLVGLVGKCRSRGLVGAEVIVPAAFTFIAWSLIFAPLFWRHYFYYYAFATGWLMTRFRTGPARSVTAAGALILLWASWSTLPPFSIPAVAHFVPLLTTLAILVCGVFDLLATSRRKATG